MHDSRFTTHLTQCSTIPSSSSSCSRQRCCGGCRKDLGLKIKIQRGRRLRANRSHAAAKPKLRRNGFAVFSRHSGSRPDPRRRQRSRRSGTHDRLCFRSYLRSRPSPRLCLLRQLARRRRLRLFRFDESSRPRQYRKRASKCAISACKQQATWPRPLAAKPSSNKASRLDSGRLKVSATRLFCAKFSGRPAVCRGSIRSAAFDHGFQPRLQRANTNPRFRASAARKVSHHDAVLALRR